MKRTVITWTLMSALCIALTGIAEAQRGRGGGGWGAGAPYGRMYDPKTVQSVSGDVLKVETFVPDKGTSRGVHLQLKTEKETIPVHLGPSWYIDNQEIKIQTGDKIEVKGSRITFEDKPAIVAAEIVKGDQVLKLRDERGVPAWAGWRRR